MGIQSRGGMNRRGQGSARSTTSKREGSDLHGSACVWDRQKHKTVPSAPADTPAHTCPDCLELEIKRAAKQSHMSRLTISVVQTVWGSASRSPNCPPAQGGLGSYVSTDMRTGPDADAQGKRGGDTLHPSFFQPIRSSFTIRTTAKKSL